MDKTYYIFRHGETSATLNKRWYWHKFYSATILEEGKPSIIKLAEYLKHVKTDFNVSSPFIRCRQTAQLVTQITGKEFAYDSRIKEYGLELPWMFKRRLLSFIKNLEISKYDKVLICTHAIVIETLIQYLEHGRIDLRERIAAPFPGVLTIITNKKSQTLNFNE
jgi:broad specificity phosphatase PhoE